jgi:hypothetical protein
MYQEADQVGPPGSGWQSNALNVSVWDFSQVALLY